MTAELAVISNPDEIRIIDMPDDRPSRGPMSVYLVYDDLNELSYIGQTSDLRRRLLQHRRDQPLWWFEAESVQVMSGLTRDEAFSIERSCIESARPWGNTQHAQGVKRRE